MSETPDLSTEVHARCHEGRWFRRAKELEAELDEARAERDKALATPYDWPEFDATDAAHPAWWRGQDDGVRGACELFAKSLDGDTAGSCSAPVQVIRDRIAALRQREAALREALESVLDRPAIKLLDPKLAGNAWLVEARAALAPSSEAE